MTEHELTPEDTAAMRAVPGDWREYLRSEMGRGRQRAQDAAKPTPPPPAPPGHQPGAWPPGTRPPDPPPPVSAAETARAVQEYRDWLTAGCPRIDADCECEPCRLLGPNPDHTRSDQ